MKPLTKDDLLYIREEEFYGLKWDKYMISCVTLKDVLSAKEWFKRELDGMLLAPISDDDRDCVKTVVKNLIDEAFGK